MRFGKLGLAAIAAASLISTPVFAQASNANLADATQANVERAASVSDETNELEGGSGIIVAILAAAAIIAGIVIAADNEEDVPTSP